MSALLSERPRLPALTSVRFFAALWVAFFHMQAMKAFFLPTAALRQFASIGYAGVSFFFVLSGFILVYTYAGRSTTLRAFWQARFARIYPALAFALLIAAPGFFYCVLQMRAHNPQLVVPEWSWCASHLTLTIVLTLTLLESWVPQAAFAWNMPNWSLSVEAFFYLAFPFLLPRLARFSRRQLFAIIPIGFLVVLACTATYSVLLPEGPVDVHTVTSWVNFFKFNPLLRLPEFLMGMAAALLFLRNPGNRRLAWPLLLGGIASTVVLIAASPHIPYLILHTALSAPAFVAIIYGLALRPTGVGFLEHPFFAALGEASYPFYLLHATIIAMFFLDWKTGLAKHQTLLGFATWLLLAVLVSVAVDRFLERPLRRLLRPKQSRPRRRRPTCSAAPSRPGLTLVWIGRTSSRKLPGSEGGATVSADQVA